MSGGPKPANALIEALRSPSAYPVATSQVEVVETHISVVFLLDSDVYKVKKPVDLGFLDFSTLERRRHFCEEEVRLNLRLAPEVYRGVVPIVRGVDGFSVAGAGEPIEYAVHMTRLPDAARLIDRVSKGEIPESFWPRLGERLARFYRGAERSDEISHGGSFETVAQNARDNLTTTERFIGMGIGAELHQRVCEATDVALAELEPLIEARASRGIPCDTHGDLRLDHVYFFPDRKPPDDFSIIDGIEFSPLFRHADPASDVAFLAMDLSFAGKKAEATALIEGYIRASGDDESRALFPFYLAYRSCVRAKVDHLTLAGTALAPPEATRLAERALGHWLLALVELEEAKRRPTLLLVGGPPGCGKSTVALGVSESRNMTWIRADEVRQEIHGGLSAAERYNASRTDEVYVECLARADAVLQQGGRALIDATFHREAPRRAALELALRRRVPIVYLDLQIGRESAHSRIASRRDDPSEANTQVHDDLVSKWEARSRGTEEIRIEISAEGTVEQVQRRADRAIDARGV